MRAAREFGDDDRFAPYRDGVLAGAAALDYVLMLASDSAGAPIPEGEARRALRDGFARAVDELIAAATAVSAIATPEAIAFARATARTLDEALRDEDLETSGRRFAVIALANA